MKNSEFMTEYEPEALISRPKPGQAVIQAFFTQKDGAVYAIVPGWPGKKFTVKGVTMSPTGKASLLGFTDSLKWKASAGGIDLELPDVGSDRQIAQYAYVIKLDGAK